MNPGNCDTDLRPVYPTDLHREAYKVDSFITVQHQFSQSITLYIWMVSVHFPLETKVIHFAACLTEAKRCSFLKSLSPLRQLFALSPPTQTVCVAPKSNIPLLALFAGYSGKFAVQQEISSLRLDEKMNYSVSPAKYPSQRHQHHRVCWYLILPGCWRSFSFWPSIIVTVFALLKGEHKGWNWSQRHRRRKTAAPAAPETSVAPKTFETPAALEAPATPETHAALETCAALETPETCAALEAPAAPKAPTAAFLVLGSW